MRSLITYLGFEYEVSEDVLVTGSLITHRRRTLRERGALRRQVWVYPRPQEWFEEIYRNRNLEALWKKHFRVTRDTFDYICQLIEGDLQKEDTRLRKAVPVYKRVAVVLWRLGSGNSYRTTGITFGLGKSTVIKICNKFTCAIIRRKDVFIKFPVDEEDVTLAIRRMKSIAGLPNVIGAIDGSHDDDDDDDYDDDGDGGSAPLPPGLNANAQGRLVRQALTDFLANN